MPCFVSFVPLQNRCPSTRPYSRLLPGAPHPSHAPSALCQVLNWHLDKPEGNKPRSFHASNNN